MYKKSWALGMIIPLAAAGAVATAPAASASPNHRFANSEECNDGRDELTLKGRITADHDDIKLTLNLETTHRRSHDRWTVTLKRQDANRNIFRDTMVKGHDDFDPVGARHRGRQEFETEATRRNQDGFDHFVARIRNHRTDETCVVRLQVGGARHQV